MSAVPYRGQLVRFTAVLRADQWAEAWLTLEVQCSQKRRGFLDSTRELQLPKQTWRRRELIGAVPADAETIVLRFLGRGEETWMDEPELEPLGPIPTFGPPQPLQGRALENLQAFARLFGVLRYFYPGDEAAKADWDKLAVEGVKAVEGASSRKIWRPDC